MFVLDTDHATFYQQGNVVLEKYLSLLSQSELATTIVTYEEQVTGRLAVIRRAKTLPQRQQAFFWLGRTLDFFCRVPVLQFDERAATTYQGLMALKLRIGTQDLLIASIALANQATLLTRNLRDYRQVPGLELQDWTTPPI